ncbi:MAG: thioredoxin domain-containing protein [Flavobacteriales bacterium]|nr:thioredoxin domain-containing protein [Flavobacteriales bacterium]
MPAHTNRLAHESSPYLLQHAHNPVDWFPWGDEAFAKARAENKLVLVSIGYSSCHWCHVMERECFEDEDVARVMNERFVCIKVDREERPDVDQVYMLAVQLMTQRGGWPLNCFTLPDGRPVYGGTYFPPAQWVQVLEQLADTYAQDPDRVAGYAGRLHEGVAAQRLIAPPQEATADHRERLRAMVERWRQQLDHMDGGPDKVPKFPMPDNYRFLLRYAWLTHDDALKRHVQLTLDKMALGGIFDQVGGGFARYSTDATWKAPHFEKMLYDNAQLVSLYSQAYQAFKKPLYKETVERTLAFIDREMTSPEGAFYSALDADTEGEEGRYYVWSDAELKEALVVDDLEFARAYYGIGAKTAWEHGRHILLRQQDDEAFAAKHGMPLNDVKDRARAINAELLRVRGQREKPGLDDKSLTSWNALMVTGWCDAFEVFGEERHKASAIRAMELILAKCRRTNGGLWHLYRSQIPDQGPGGKASINGFLEDYCFTIEALLALYGITFDERWITEAQALAEHAIRHFHDAESGLFNFTSDLDPTLITRPMELHDNVIPASNSSMANGLFILGTLLGDERYMALSDRAIGHGAAGMTSHPTGHSHWAQGLLMRAFPLYEIAITGSDALRLRAGFAPHYLPNRLFAGCTTTSTLPLLKDRILPASTIFVCVENACQLPVHTVDAAVQQIR